MFGTITSLNTISLEHMADEEYEEAVAVLSCTVNELSHALLMPQPVPEEQQLKAKPTKEGIPALTNRQGSCTLDYTHYKYYLLKGEDEDQRRIKTTSNEQAVEDVDFYKLAVAISFHEDLFDTNDPFMTSEEHCICTIATLFNLGLAYQLWWSSSSCSMKDQPNDVPRLKKYLLLQALQAYIQVWELLKDSRAFSMDALERTDLHSPQQDQQEDATSPHPRPLPATLFPVLMAVCTNAIYCVRELWAHQALANEWNRKLGLLIATMDRETHRQMTQEQRSSTTKTVVTTLQEEEEESNHFNSRNKETCEDLVFIEQDDDEDTDIAMNDDSDAVLHQNDMEEDDGHEDDMEAQDELFINYKADCKFFRLKAFHNSFGRTTAQAA